jgi:hypothetical protein
MTPSSDLFRQEAVEVHSGQQQPDGVLRVDHPWTRWAYWLVLALLVAGVVVTATAHTSETTSGPALIDVRARTFGALVPGAASPDLRPGQSVRLDVQGLDGPPLAARTLKAEVADEAAVRRAGFPSPSQPAVLVTGVLGPHADVGALPPSPRHEARAVVVLRSQRILDLFLRQLHGTLGRGTPEKGGDA